MKKSGFIRYFQIYPNYRLLGIGGGSAYLFELDDPERKNAIINQCALVDGVTEITSFVGNEVCIDFTYHDPKDESRRLKLLLGLTNCKRAEKFYDRVMPPVRFELSNTSLDCENIMRCTRVGEQEIMKECIKAYPADNDSRACNSHDLLLRSWCDYTRGAKPK